MTNQELYELMARFEGSSLSGMKLSQGDFSLELRRDGPAAAPSVPAAAAAAPVPPEAESPVIQAPLVGTYYAAPSPDAAPFVAAGDKVKKGQTVCLIEAMKLMSEVPAPCDCIIEAVLKESGSLAAFGEPLFRYRPC
jgi:acetyl-CoA carboxylase biotin carboxyl carrier protein